MFLVILTYKKPLDTVDDYLEQHRAFLEQCYQKNHLIVSGPRVPRMGGILLSQITDREQLMGILHQDPFYVNGVADYDVIEFNPVKHHPDFIKFI